MDCPFPYTLRASSRVVVLFLTIFIVYIVSFGGVGAGADSVDRDAQGGRRCRGIQPLDHRVDEEVLAPRGPEVLSARDCNVE